jgi:pimeloyl-ACP methyl ester carboxylesterase
MIPIILIHGAQHNSSVWNDYIEKLKEYNKYEIISYELLGHGNRITDNNKKYTLNEYAIDLNNHIKNKKNIIIISHSLGCLITYYYLLHYDNARNIINKIFFLAPGIMSLSLLPSKSLCKLFIYGNFGNNNDDIRDFLFCELTDESIIDSCSKNLEKTNCTSLLSIISFMFQYETVDDIPCFFISGEYDKIFPPKTVRYIKHFFTNSHYKCFQAAGHNLMLEHNRYDILNYILHNI